MRWPPNKAWTSFSLREGFRHFVAINYGGKGQSRWVNLVAVLDSRSSFRVSWEEMQDTSKWNSGWEQLSRDESNPSHERADDNTFKTNGMPQNENICLHPSKDSGFLIPSEIFFSSYNSLICRSSRLLNSLLFER